MRILILTLLLLTSCATIGTRTLIQNGEKVCYYNMGLHLIELHEDSWTNYRWIIAYKCIDGRNYSQGIK